MSRWRGREGCEVGKAEQYQIVHSKGFVLRPWRDDWGGFELLSSVSIRP